MFDLQLGSLSLILMYGFGRYTLYEKGSRRSEGPASLVKRSVIKISRRGGREREKRRSIHADSGPSVFFPPSIDVFSQLQPERGEERRRGDGDVGCVLRCVCVLGVCRHIVNVCTVCICVSVHGCVGEKHLRFRCLIGPG